MAKSFTVEATGRKSLGNRIVKQSLGEYIVRTSDLDVSLAHLLAVNEVSVLIGTCVNVQQSRWETLRINKSQLREFRKLTSR